MEVSFSTTTAIDYFMQHCLHLKCSIPQGPVGIAFRVSTLESRKFSVCTEGGMLFVLLVLFLSG